MNGICNGTMFLVPARRGPWEGPKGQISLDFKYFNPNYVRVGSHVVSVRIHCTEKWRTSFHTDVLSKSK